MSAPFYKNRRKLVEWTSNSVLFAIVVISWTYAIIAGRYGLLWICISPHITWRTKSWVFWANLHAFPPLKGCVEEVLEHAGPVAVSDGAQEQLVRRCRRGQGGRPRSLRGLSRTIFVPRTRGEKAEFTRLKRITFRLSHRAGLTLVWNFECSPSSPPYFLL